MVYLSISPSNHFSSVFFRSKVSMPRMPRNQKPCPFFITCPLGIQVVDLVGGWRYPAVTVREQTNICIYRCIYLIYIIYLAKLMHICKYHIYIFILLCTYYICTGRITATSYDLSPLKGSQGRKLTFFQRNLSWRNIMTLARYTPLDLEVF